MKYSQRKHTDVTRFAVCDEALAYIREDTSCSRSYSVPYTDISLDLHTLVGRNPWLGNVGLLWLLLGAGLTAFSFMGDGGPRVSVWFWVGAACYAAYRYRTTRFTIVPTDKGNLCVIDDADGQRILEQIELHRARQFRSEYDFMPEGDSPEQLRGRFKWLHKDGALSDEELRQRMVTVDALDQAREETGMREHGARLY